MEKVLYAQIGKKFLIFNYSISFLMCKNKESVNKKTWIGNEKNRHFRLRISQSGVLH